jgi:hypothetical protein
LRCRGLGTKRLKGAPCEAYLGADDSAGQVREFCIRKTQFSRGKSEIFCIKKMLSNKSSDVEK